MTKTATTSIMPTTPRKPDGVITTLIQNQTIIVEVFFNHDTKDTFQDKLVKVVLADKTA